VDNYSLGKWQFLNLSPNNDAEITENKIQNFSKKAIDCHKDS